MTLIIETPAVEPEQLELQFEALDLVVGGKITLYGRKAGDDKRGD